ncbi:hypothetical protein [Umezawaea sp. Da 62-37]|uniref:hypothetical protein n=1 Tax=Umezawaea sp. Da 62-37 TaxID=3075927 RepID=UPI0028F72717|nr:hypothetical protein [Umezawaea sp. Da 62-37]WNV85484.1 hypothetical protein RM788_46430 [Umezawaea sp. Da 62-37]
MNDTPQGRLGRVVDDMRVRWTGRDVVMAVNHFNGGMKALAEELDRSGARLAAVVINTVPRADDPPAEHVWSCAEHGLTMSHRQYEVWLASKPQEVVDWLDGLDPDREWEVLGTTYSEFEELGGRPAYGRWLPEWAVWEDKTRIDELWQRVGIPAPPHVIVDVDDPDLAATAVSLDQGHGVMIAIDTTLDVLGSSQGLRWVRSRAELDTAVEVLRARTERVRIATFVPGVPCSLMGMVFDDGVAVFDPIEVITLHRPSTGQLVYGGCSTTWRPADARREVLRDYARRVGQDLSTSLGYTGVFSVDGLSGADGFVATELNPRHVSGIGVRPGWPEFPTRLLNRAVQGHLPEAAGAGWQDVEEAYREVVRRTPSASLWIEVPEGADIGEEGRVLTTAVSVPVGDSAVECVVEYRPQCGGAWIIGASTPTGAVPHDGALGPVTAAFAEKFGVPDLASFGEITARSTLTG